MRNLDKNVIFADVCKPSTLVCLTRLKLALKCQAHNLSHVNIYLPPTADTNLQKTLANTDVVNTRPKTDEEIQRVSNILKQESPIKIQ